MRSVYIGFLGVMSVLGLAQAGRAQTGPIDAVRAATWPVPLVTTPGQTVNYTPVPEAGTWRGHVTVLKSHDDGSSTLPDGRVMIQSFFDVFSEITLPDLSTTVLQGPGYGRFIEVPGTNTFDTEMLSLNLSGGGPVMIRESPTRASTGRTSAIPYASGYRIDSFFDVFTELSVDGGQTWVTSDTPNTPLHVETPEPSTLAILAVGALSLSAFVWRRSKYSSRDG